MVSVTEETFTVEPPDPLAEDEDAAGDEPDEDEPDEDEQAAAARTAAVPATATRARPRLGRKAGTGEVMIDGFLVLSGSLRTRLWWLRPAR
jgi:hypothetical protein